MLIKLRRKLFSVQRLIIGLVCFLFFYLILSPISFYAKVGHTVNDQRLRNYLVSFLSSLEHSDLNLDQNVHPDYVNKLFVKNLKLTEESRRKGDSIDHLINDDLETEHFNFEILKNLNFGEQLNSAKWNSIRRNLNKFTTRDLLGLVVKVKNHQQLVTNLDRYKLNEFKTVIAVQVHERIHYLRLLIESLSKVKGIENCLLVFSHDLFDLEINKLVEEIRYAIHHSLIIHQSDFSLSFLLITIPGSVR